MFPVAFILNMKQSTFLEFVTLSCAFFDPCVLRQVNVLALSICTREAYKSMTERNVDDGHIIHINRYDFRKSVHQKFLFFK